MEVIETKLTDDWNAQTVLVWRTPSEWGSIATTDLAALMSDHAWCERKASGTCLSLLASHTEFPQMAEPMIRLAREELEHFQLVYNLMEERGFRLTREVSNLYVKNLRTHIRNGDVQLLDRLLVSALIEARSCERLGLIAEALQDTRLKDFYSRLQKAESRHFVEFFEIAVSIYGYELTRARLDEMRKFESEEIVKVPFGPRVH